MKKKISKKFITKKTKKKPKKLKEKLEESDNPPNLQAILDEGFEYIRDLGLEYHKLYEHKTERIRISYNSENDEIVNRYPFRSGDNRFLFTESVQKNPDSRGRE